MGNGIRERLQLLVGRLELSRASLDLVFQIVMSKDCLLGPLALGDVALDRNPMVSVRPVPVLKFKTQSGGATG